MAAFPPRPRQTSLPATSPVVPEWLAQSSSASGPAPNGTAVSDRPEAWEWADGRAVRPEESTPVLLQ
eukprot:3275676-Alexandrium_andersonii.AAC.1